MILITGAGGKTGRTLIDKLVQDGLPVRTFVRRPEHVESLRQLGASEVMIGSLESFDDLLVATQNIQIIYHICPNMHPQEVSIGASLLNAAKSNGVERIVYHSVLHPQVEEMPHHWNKLRVEELLFKSGLDYTILQPAAYMQNLLAYRKTISETGVYRVPYATETRIGMVDLHDIAEAAAKIIRETGHSGAIYELAGAEVLSQTEIAQILSQAIGRPVRAEAQDRAQWAQSAAQSGLAPYAIDTLLRMFSYYEAHGFWGNPRVLEMLLGRKMGSFAEWVRKHLEV